MAENFNTRNVAQKEIYDSYMGILRISPNEINGTEFDDATQLLNTLYDEDKKQRTEIILSDSDGNILPITFQPRAFEQSVIRRNVAQGIDTEQKTDVLNVSTIIGISGGTKGNLYVSDTLKCRSTLIVTAQEEEDQQKWRHSTIRIMNGGKLSPSSKKITGKGWILYPTECPNDDNYFNVRNQLELFDKNDTSTPRYKQVDEALKSKTREWHTQIPLSQRVHAGGKTISQVNIYSEEIPVYYTYDYVLGHYDSHQCIAQGEGNALHDTWGISGETTEGITDYVTKLSWCRFDKLIWDSLDEILSGNVRHTDGRYTDLGKDEKDDITTNLALTGEYLKNAPLLGTEVPRGIVMYHAMPFHRYWFYRTRQALRTFIERRKFDKGFSVEDFEQSDFTNFDDYVVLEKKLNGNGWEEENKIADEIERLQSYYENGLLTPCPMGTVSSVQSLAKNFVLCNGQTVKFQNFPNISLTNDAIFNTIQRDQDGNELVNKHGNYITGGIANCDWDEKGNAYFIHNHDTVGYGTNKVLHYVAASLEGANGIIKLPNLFALFEKSSRFIRGLNWKITQENTDFITGDEIVRVFDSTAQHKTTYVNPICNGSIEHEIFKNNEYTFMMDKKISNVSKLYFHTYDHLEDKETHQHNMFSAVEGDKSSATYNTERIHNYHCRNTRGTNSYLKFRWLFRSLMNFDRTYSLTFGQAMQDDNAFNNTKHGGPISVYRMKATADKENIDYIQYCLGKVYEGECYRGFTPIPTIGLTLFNSSIINNKGNYPNFKKESSEEINSRGTITVYKEEETSKTDNKTDVTTVTINITNYDFEGVNYNPEIRQSTEDTKYIYKNIEEKTPKYKSIYYVDAEGTKHYLHEEAPISVQYFNIPEDVENDEGNSAYLATLHDYVIEHDKEKQRRKFFARKMNEAEGFIPISYYGKAQGQIKLSWSRDERSGWHSSSRNTYHDYKNNVASYIMTQIPGNNIKEEPDEEGNVTYWRCLTSVAYHNPYKLGVGDVKNYIENVKNYNEFSDYYDVNSVTQLPVQVKPKEYSYGDFGVELDENCPNPNVVNLLPLIRL